jgi:hypothetical protein
MIAPRVRLLTATLAGVTALGGAAAVAQTPPPSRPEAPAVVRLAAAAAGSIYGSVLDESGEPVAGAVVSALGSSTAFAVTDRAGHYRITELPAGPYVVRAHRDGFAGARSTLVNVRPSAKAPSSFTLKREAPPVALAGVGVGDAAAGATRDESPMAWRLRRLTRSVLKEEQGGPDLAPSDDTWMASEAPGFFERAVDASARFASSVFPDWPLNGQVNLLTATAYDDAGEMVAFGTPSGVAFFAVGAPVGDHGDWSARAAMNSGDISSWTMAGDYTSRPGTRHRLAFGLTYSLQDYRPTAFSGRQVVPEGHRKVATLSASHEFAPFAKWRVGYGTRYEHYDYLNGYGLVSPTARLTFTPAAGWAVHTKASLQQVAPGAEEFVPPADAQWVPPQRTFAPLGRNGLNVERVAHYELGVTREFRDVALSFKTFRQNVDNQLVTVFGAADPARLIAAGGHYGIASAGDATMQGWTVGVVHAVTAHVRGRVDYSVVAAQWTPSAGADRRALLASAPQAMRQPHERVHDVSASIDAEVPQTDTRMLVLYRVNTGFAGSPSGIQTGNGRFDVQLRQGIPFIGGLGDWEMLLGVRSLFRSTLEDRSIYDELLVVRAPKRLIGGLQVRF